MSALTFKRMGDFYEAFDDDAKTVADVLGIALTKRGDRQMCGIPAHAAAEYFAQLSSAGHTVRGCA